MTTSEATNEIAGAAAKAQSELKPASKDATNPHFRSKYADLAAILDASRVYAKHGIAIFQEPVMLDTGIAVSTRLVHSSGQWIQFEPLTIPLSKRDAHGVGSATTYAKRYALQAALGISADEDDDGNAAVKASAEPVTVEAPPAVMRAPLPDGAFYVVRSELKQYGGDITVMDEHGVEFTYPAPDRQCAELCEQLAQENPAVPVTLERVVGKRDGKAKLKAVHRVVPPAPTAEATEALESELPL